MLAQYMELCTINFVFLCPHDGCGVRTSGMVICLSFMMTASITAMLSLNDQYGLISWCSWSLLSGHPVIIKHFNHCKCSSCAVAWCICWINMHSGTFINVCTASTHTLILFIASSFFSLWLCQDSQSKIKNSSPGLYTILALY